MEQKITVRASHVGQRLDKFLLMNFPQYSRTFIKEQIKAGNILIYPVRSLPIKSGISRPEPKAKSPYGLIDKPKQSWASGGVGGKKVKPSYVLRQGDAVALAQGFSVPTKMEIQPNPNIKLNIIYEDDSVIVIDKPAGLAVHPRQTKTGAPLVKELSNTLVSGLLAHYPPLASVGDLSTSSGQAAIRPGLVHRLDKDTSGLMIIAKNQKSFTWLKKQFQERKVQKKYIALIVGHPKENSGVIKTYLTRSVCDPSKQKIVPLDSTKIKGKLREAITEYQVIKNFKDFTLVEAYPKTGRLHQIRAQFAWLGNPVAGDTKYGPKNRPVPAGLNRQFLHATELKIILPNGQKRTFSSPLPHGLTQILVLLD